MEYQDVLKEAGAVSPSGPGWLTELRKKAFRRFEALGFPTRRDESWRYLNLGPIVKTPFQAVARDGAPLDEAQVCSAFLSQGESHRLVFVNGLFSEKFSSPGKLPAGVVLRNLAAALSRNESSLRPVVGREQEEETNPFAAINTFQFQDGVYLFIPKETEVPSPIHLLFVGCGKADLPQAYYPRLVVVLEPGAKANLVLDQIGLEPGKIFMDGVGEFILGKNSRLNIVSLQREIKEASRFLTTRFYQKEGSRLDFTVFSRGGAILRNDIEVELEGEEASATLRGLALLSGFSQAFNHVLVNHRVPRGTSRQVFKNVLADKSQAEYTSMVHVWRDAQKSDTDQQDRNLLLSDEAKAYSRPQLKIDADDVKCTHGAATGQIVGDELFYLRSRGLDDKLARTVLTFGFAEEILQAIPLPPVRRQLGDWVHQELQAMLGSSPLLEKASF